MQELADILAGLFVIFLGYKVFLSFGVWMEKRAERIGKEAKKLIK